MTSIRCAPALAALPLLALLLLPLPACGGDDGCGGTQAERVAAVRASFDAYRQALIDRDGERAAALVDAGTLAYYGEMHDVALHAPEAEVRALGAADKIFVLTMRHQMTEEELAPLSAAQLFAHGVEQQWIGRDSVEVNLLGEIRLDSGDAALARGELLAYGAPGELQWTFRCEDGGWKLDLLAVLRLADETLDAMVRQGGADEDEVLLSILESVSGARPGAELWQPLAGR